MVPNNPSAKGIRNAAGHAKGLKGELSGKTNRDANRPEDQRIEDLGHDPVGGVEAEREAYLAQGDYVLGGRCVAALCEVFELLNTEHREAPFARALLLARSSHARPSSRPRRTS